jgi:hypothetical protein
MSDHDGVQFVLRQDGFLALVVMDHQHVLQIASLLW